MPPQYRATGQTRRGNRGGAVDHDDFEGAAPVLGSPWLPLSLSLPACLPYIPADTILVLLVLAPGLPVRQWRQEVIRVAPPPPPDTHHKRDRWTNVFPFGIPKDYRILPPHSQDLLRAARSGLLYKRPAPPEEEDAEGEPADPVPAGGQKSLKKDSDPAAGDAAAAPDRTPDGFRFKMWRLLPRSIEAPTVSHLAKRRKNTVTLASHTGVLTGSGGASAPGVRTVVRATVRRIDAAGNPYEQTITLVSGQPVDGEIISTTTVEVPLSAGGLDGELAPARKRPPPPRRKAKGLGRGKKKGRLPVEVATNQAKAETGATFATPASAPGTAGGAGDADAASRAAENGNSTNQDGEMADASMMPSDDEEGDEGGAGDEGNDGDSEGDEGDGDDQQIAGGETETPAAGMDTSMNDDDDDDQDLAMDTDSDGSALTPIPPPPPNLSASGSSSGQDGGLSRTNSPLGLAPSAIQISHPLLSASPRIEGSPLKNVIMPSPTEASPTVLAGPAALASTSGDGYLGGSEPPDVEMQKESSADMVSAELDTERATEIAAQAVVEEVVVDATAVAVGTPTMVVETSLVETSVVQVPAVEPSEALPAEDPPEEIEARDVEMTLDDGPGDQSEEMQDLGLQPDALPEPEPEQELKSPPAHPLPESMQEDPVELPKQVSPEELLPDPHQEPSQGEQEEEEQVELVAHERTSEPQAEQQLEQLPGSPPEQPSSELAAERPSLLQRDSSGPDLLSGLERELDHRIDVAPAETTPADSTPAATAAPPVGPEEATDDKPQQKTAESEKAVSPATTQPQTQEGSADGQGGAKQDEADTAAEEPVGEAATDMAKP